MTTFNCSWVEVSEANWLAEISVPPMESFSPGRKPLPLMLRVCGEFEPTIGLGRIDLMEGAAAALTVRITGLLACPLGEITCTGRLWAAIPRVTLMVICEALMAAICAP